MTEEGLIMRSIIFQDPVGAVTPASSSPLDEDEEWNQTHTTQQGRLLIPPLIHPLRRSNALFYILPFLRQGLVFTLAKTVQGM
jgi:hypothetical protein